MAGRKRFSAEYVISVLDRIGRLGRVEKEKPPSRVVPRSGRVICREIVEADREQAIDILTDGFNRHRSYWIGAFQRLTEHSPPAGYPRFGHVLVVDGVFVGIGLTIYSSRYKNGVMMIRCNGSSIYVHPYYRGHAAILFRQVSRYKEVTYLNITPAPHTLPIIRLLGFQPFSTGQVVAALWLTPRAIGVQIYNANDPSVSDYVERLHPYEIDIFRAHQTYDCLCLVCLVGDRVLPFVFAVRRRFGVKIAHLIYTRCFDDVAWLAGTIGHVLLRHHVVLAVLDANGPIPNLRGVYLAIRAKYAMGPSPPQPGDIPFTEQVMFGF